MTKAEAKRLLTARLSGSLEKQAFSMAVLRAAAGGSPNKVGSGRMIKNVLLGSGILAGAGALLGLGGMAADAGYEATVGKHLRETGYTRMLKKYPALKKSPATATKDMYDTLWQFSPEIAKNPLTAASWIKGRMEFDTEGIQPPDIKMLTDIQKGFSDKEKNKAFRQAFSPAVLGGISGLSKL